MRCLKTEGRTLLTKLLAAAPFTQGWFARALGIDQSTVSLWKAGRGRPEPHLRAALAKLVGIPEQAWMTAGERGVVALAVERATLLAAEEVAVLERLGLRAPPEEARESAAAA